MKDCSLLYREFVSASQAALVAGIVHTREYLRSLTVFLLLRYTVVYLDLGYIGIVTYVSTISIEVLWVTRCRLFVETVLRCFVYMNERHTYLYVT